MPHLRVILRIAVILGLFIAFLGGIRWVSLADQTSSFLPIADGGDDGSNWQNTSGTGCDTTSCFTEVKETSGSSCSSTSDGDTTYIQSAANPQTPQTFDISESSIPDNSTISELAITVCAKEGTPLLGGTYQTRQCHNGSCTNSETDVSTGSSYVETTQTMNVNYTKTSASDIEIGVRDTSGNSVRVSRISVVITYTPPAPPAPVGVARTPIFGYGPFGGEVTLLTDDPISPRPILSQRISEASGKFSLELTGTASGRFDYLLAAKDKEGRQSTLQKLSLDIPSVSGYGPYLLPPTLELSKSGIRTKERLFVFGFASPGSTVELVFEEAKKTWSATAASDGSYSIAIATDELSIGTHHLKARQKVGSDWSSLSPGKTLEILLEEKERSADFNNDGKVNLSDWETFLSSWRAKEQNLRLLIDIDGDGKLTIKDTSIFLYQLKGL